MKWELLACKTKQKHRVVGYPISAPAMICTLPLGTIKDWSYFKDTRKPSAMLRLVPQKVFSIATWAQVVLTLNRVPHFLSSLLNWNCTLPSWTVPVQSGLFRCKTSAGNPASERRQRDTEIQPELLWHVTTKPERDRHYRCTEFNANRHTAS